MIPHHASANPIVPEGAAKIMSAPRASVSAMMVFFTTPSMKRSRPAEKSSKFAFGSRMSWASISWYLMIGPASSLGKKNT